MPKLCNLWKHHAAYLKDIHYRKDDCKPCQSRNYTKCEISQTVMVKNHAFKLKYLMDYRILKVLNKSTLLLVSPVW